jgi:hypothetical protein
MHQALPASGGTRRPPEWIWVGGQLGQLHGPQSRAHHLLKGPDLGGAGSALRQAGQIIFEGFGGSPVLTYGLNCAMTRLCRCCRRA